MSTEADSGLTIPRDASHYRLSVHAGQQRVDRDIPKAAIADTLETGSIRQTHRPNVRMFTKQYPGDEWPVAVVADVVSGEILTVEMRDDRSR